MKTNAVLRYCGISLVVVALLMLVAAGVAFHEKSESALLPLLYAGVITGIVGLFPLIFVPRQKSIGAREGFFIVTFSWILACLFGAIPYLMYGGEFTLVNAFFESVSGFTTTGASILTDIEALPNGLLFWRIASAWIGGIGIVALVSMVIPTKNDLQSVLASAESSDLARGYYGGRKKHFVSMMLTIYIGITLISALSLKCCGMRWFDAVTHAMSACSTCGFSTRNDSIAAFDSPAVELVLIVAMLLGGTNFTLLQSTFLHRQGGRTVFHSEIFRTFMAGILAASLVTTADLLLSGWCTSAVEAARHSFFQIASISTTTGFATADTDSWPALSITVICLCSVICGCTGSTSGGIKVDRALLAAKGMREKVRSIGHPSRVECIRIDGSIRKTKEMEDACIFILFYLSLSTAGGFVNAMGGMDLRSGLSAAIACMGNVGPGFGSVGSMGNYSALPDALKINSMILMLLGRLEIYPFFLIFGSNKR
ncbi:MAG: TrkH family potassium uptake protein [Bacteroidales bacterium]|nr:TrkH family potassium uptake protein [Bacteroidales bacterium]